MWFKRIISLILVTTLLFGMMPVSGSAAEVPEVDTGDVTIAGTNGFGNLLSEAISEEQEQTESEHNGGYTVTDLEIVDNVATVTYDTMEEAILIVALYSEDGMQMLSSAKATVTPEATEATITFDGTMPEYFLASAYLVDVYDLSPLCAAYDTPMYTREMQELLASTVDDYDPEKVLNLDEDETTNFAVYAETTKVIQYVEGYNIVASINDETATYVIENADEQFTSLQAGDIFAYPYGECEMLILKVGSILLNGSTVTVTGNELEIGEVFSYVKLDGKSESEDVSVDDSTAGEGITYLGRMQDDENTYNLHAFEEEGGISVGHTFELNVVKEKHSTDHTELEFSIIGKFKIELGIRFKYYVSLTKQYVECRITPKAELSANIQGKAVLKTPLGKLNASPVPGVLIGFKPELQLTFEVDTELKVTFSSTIGFAYDNSTGLKNLSSAPDVVVNLKGEATIFFGIDFKPTIALMDGMIASIEVKSLVGFELKGTASQDFFEEDADSYHLCTDCMELEINFKAELTGKMEFLKQDWLTIEVDIRKWTVHLGEAYISFSTGKFGWGSCPNQKYRITVEVKDAEKQPIADALVTASEETYQTNSSGLIVCYLPNGSHTIKAESGDLTKKTSIYVDEARKLTLTLKPASSDEGTGSDMNEDTYADFVFGEIKEEEVVDYGSVVASGECGAEGDNVTWTLYSSGFLDIQGSGEMMNYTSRTNSPWRSFNTQIVRARIGDGVSNVGDYAFDYCRMMTTVHIPNTVAHIGRNAFFECYKLKEVSIPDSVISIGDGAFDRCLEMTHISLGNGLKEIGVRAFGDCRSLTDVVLPEGIAVIPDYAFINCSQLKNVGIPTTVIEIGDYAFHHCKYLVSADIPEGVAYIGKSAFGGCALTKLIIPGTVTEIGEHSYEGCSQLTDVTIHDGTISLGDYAFLGCNILENISLGNSLEKIGYGTFQSCISLNNVVLPNSLTYVGDYAFKNCHALNQIHIPNSVTYIGGFAFGDCKNLKSVSLSDRLTSISYALFSGCESLTDVTLPEGIVEIGDIAFAYCAALPQIIIPHTVLAIGSGAFAGCTNLKTVTIPEGVTNIGSGAFSGCSALEEIAIPTTVTKICDYLFYNCASLLVVDLPESLTEIGEFVFSGCSSLQEIDIPDAVTEIGEMAFENCESLRSIVIPEGIEKVYNGTFIGCKNLETVVIPDSVTQLMTAAFRYCEKLNNIILPSNLTRMGMCLFQKCNSLTYLEIPASVEYIDSQAFYGCTGLECITFLGDAPGMNSNAMDELVTTCRYPADNATWTSDVMQDYGGTITWVPYTLDENGDMVINEAAAVTMAAEEASEDEAELLNVMAEQNEAEAAKTGLGLPSQDFEKQDETLNPNAVYGGEYSTEVTDTYTLKTASFIGLVPNQQYVLLAMKSVEVEDPMTANNLLFIDQAAAGEDGTLKFTYVQRESTDVSYVVACGASNKNLKDAEITFPEMTADGELQVVEPTVVYDGETLEEGRDYTIVGTVSFTEAGTYTCYIRGIHNYTGLVECTYTVKEAEIKNFVKWVSGTTSLNGTIDLNIYVALSEDLINADDTYVRFTYAGKTVDVSMANAHHSPKGDYDNCYRFSCPVYAKQVADTVNVKFMKGDQAVGEELNYSVQQYCVNQIKKSSDAELVALCKALLNYGTAAQQMFDYNTGNSANASLSDADKALAAVDATAYKYSVTGSESGIKASSATLMLEEMVKVRVYFKLTGSKTIDEFTFTIDGKQVAIRQNEKGYYVETAGIAAKDLEKMFTIQVGGITVKYGALSYVNSKAGDTNTLAVNISKALFAYWQAAEALLG